MIRERTSAKFFAVDGVAIVVINALTLVVALRVLSLVGHVINPLTAGELSQMFPELFKKGYSTHAQRRIRLRNALFRRTRRTRRKRRRRSETRQKGDDDKECCVSPFGDLGKSSKTDRRQKKQTLCCNSFSLVIVIVIVVVVVVVVVVRLLLSLISALF